MRILIADDDAIFRTLLRSQLAKRVEHFAEAADGNEAWQLLASEPFDLAIIDLSMPALDGLGLISCMRGHPRTRNVPVIVVTCRNERAAFEEALEAGATSFLTKPVNWSLFNLQVDYLLRLIRAASSARVLRVRAEAAARVKDRLFATLEREVGGHLAALDDRLERMLGGRQGPMAIATELIAMRHQLRAASDTLGLIGPYWSIVSDCVAVDDRRVGLESLVDASVKLTKELLAARGILLEIEPLPEDLRITCDDAAMARAIANMIEDAVEATAAPTAVRLSADLLADEGLSISVGSRGDRGTPAGGRAHAGPAEDEPESISTLGIPMARAIAEAHGGALEIRTTPGEGTVRSIFVPGDRVHMAAGGRQ